MRCEDALIHFHTAYSAARNDRRRPQAIYRFRNGVVLGEGEAPSQERHHGRFQEQLAEDTAPPDGNVVLCVLVSLLRRVGRGGPEARSAAAELLRDLWRRLAPVVSAELFCQFTRRLLKSSLLLPDEERCVLFAAIEGGCAAANPSVVAQLCLDVLAGEGERCVFCPVDGLLAPPTPSFDALRFVTQCAPVGIWPRLARDLWRLYNRDTDPVNRLTLPELLTLHRSEAGLRRRRRAADGTTLGGSFGPVLRRDRDGQPVSTEICWDTARKMLLRTLAELRSPQRRAPHLVGRASASLPLATPFRS